MLIHSRPNSSQRASHATSTKVEFTHCTIRKITSSNGKVQLVFETELSDVALLEQVKAAVGMSAGLVDITLVERPDMGENEKVDAKRKN